MKSSVFRPVRSLHILVGLFALLLLTVATAAAQAPPLTVLEPVAVPPDAAQAVAGSPYELTVAKRRDGQPAIDEVLDWSLEDPESGVIEVMDARTRAGAEGVEAGSGRARFTPARAGSHGIRVVSLVDPACAGVDCRQVAHRFVVTARAGEGDEPPSASGTGRPNLALLAAGVAGAAAIASTTGSDGGGGSSARTLSILTGNGQGGLANTALPVPLTVLALDGGQPAAGVVIQWTVSGGATISAGSVTTGADGRASVIVTNLGPGPGPVAVTATRADQPSASVPFTLAINIAALEKVSGDNQPTPVDTTTAAPLVVRALLNGAPQAGVVVQWQVVSGNGAISGASAVTDANGLAQAFVDVGPLPGALTILASRADSPMLQQLFTVDALELRELVIAGGDGQSGAQNTTLPLPLSVQALDGGIGDPGVTILWSATGGAQLSAGSTVTDTGGIASVTVVSMGLGLDPVTVTAFRADQPLLMVEFTLNVTPPSLAVVAGDGQVGLSGQQAATPMQVQLLDGDGQPMAGQTVFWQVLSGSATLNSPVSVTDGAGNASVGFTYGNFPGPVVIRASAFANGVSVTANAQGLPPGSIGPASGDGQTGDPGDVLPLPLVVQLVDPAPDLSGVPITFTVVSGSATLAPAVAITDTAGQASTQVTLGLTPGPVVIQATAPGGVVTLFNANVTGTLVVTGITASGGDAQTLTPGVPSAPMVVELIGNGVPVVGETVVWSTSAGTLASPTTVTDANGRTSNTVTVTGAGTTVVTASFPTFAAFVGSNITFTHTSGLAALPSLSINEASVAEALDAACALLQVSGGLTPDEQDLLEQCLALTAASTSDPAAVGDALTAMLPDVAQTQADAGRSAVGAQFENLNSRMMGLRSGAPTTPVSFAGLTLAMSGGRLPLGQLGAALMALEAPSAEEESSFGRWGLFVSGNIGRGEFDPTQLTPRYDFDIAGLTAGLDYRWSDTLVVGVALGYTQQDTQLAGDLGSVDMRGFSLSGYGTWYRGNDWYLDGALTLGSNRYDHERSIAYVLPGEVVDQTAVASSDGSSASATVTFGRDFSRGAWTFGVYGRAAYNRMAFDSFEEEVDASLNGNGLALRVESRTVTATTSTLGGKAAFAYSASWGVLVPQLEVEWVKEFGGDAEAFRGFFVDDPTATPILVLGDDLDSSYLRVGLGLSMVLGQGRSGFFNYERYLARSGISQQGATLGVRWEF
jgi:outer membrane autotransporter protein